MTGLLRLYGGAARALELTLLPGWLRARGRAGKEDAARLAERLGREPGERPPGRLIHLHGASVGEALSLLPLVRALAAAAPDAGLLVTSGTATSAALMRERLPPGVLHRLTPVDAPGVTARWTARWRPDLSVFVESEVWPNWLASLRGAGARTALLSARLSPASVRGWGRAPASARAVFGGFDLVRAQDDAVAVDLVRLGARDDGRLNLKLAAPALPVAPEALAAARAQAGGARVLAAVSTHPGEDDVALDAFRTLGRPDALLVVVPRHPERGAAVAGLAGARGLRVGLRSAGAPLAAGGVHVADTLGETGLWFALAAEGGSVLTGGSLVAGVGGHNPVEPVRAGAPLRRGPHVENWPSVYARLGDAAPVAADAAALARGWAADMDDPHAAAARAARAAARLPEEDVREAARALLALLPPRP